MKKSGESVNAKGDTSPGLAATGDVFRSAGQRALVELAHTGAEVARRIGSNPKTVSAWRTGRKIPAPDAQRALHQAFDIAPAAWTSLDQPPASAPPARRSEAPDATAQATTLDGVDQLLAAIRATRSNATLTASERLKAGAEERALLALRGRFARQADLDMLAAEDAWARCAPWKHLCGVVLDALAPFPAALAAVIEALEHNQPKEIT